MPRALDQLKFVSSYTQLPDSLHVASQPTPLKGSQVISVNPDIAQDIGIDLCSLDLEKLANFCGGHNAIPGSNPIAMKYTGHQFGVYNPDLGDGRGLLLGEVEDEAGVLWDLHLKGAGKTRFSRFGDGKAVLRSSIREYLVSAAMRGLNIPTTQALCLTNSEQMTMRNGMEPCATVLRVTQSHIRFGHFEYLYYTKQHDELKVLADYVISRYMPRLANEEKPYHAMFSTVLERSAKLVAAWQAYGFVHGVLNTDNMSIIGETFDYGPYSFLDEYDMEYVSNKNDHEGRYAFKNQPGIVQWNLSALAQALLPIVDLDFLKEELDRYWSVYNAAYRDVMRTRLGLIASNDEKQDEQHDILIKGLEQLFIDNRVDLTRFFRVISDYEGQDALSQLEQLVTNHQQLGAWFGLYEKYLEKQSASYSAEVRQAKMQTTNPVYILRNYMAEEAIRDAHMGDYKKIAQILELVRQPYVRHEEDLGYDQAPPSWAAAINLTCSS
ncbi:MAG: protein adenylyltransferase SelO [Pontibacterium sp.]